MFPKAIRLALVLLCAACLAPSSRAQQSDAQPSAQTKQEAPPAKKNARPDGDTTTPEPFDKATAEQMSKQCVTLDTEEGAIVVEMLAEAAPETVRNFLNLAATGAYDTTTFSRVVKGFVIQGGDLSTRAPDARTRAPLDAHDPRRAERRQARARRRLDGALDSARQRHHTLLHPRRRRATPRRHVRRLRSGHKRDGLG